MFFLLWGSIFGGLPLGFAASGLVGPGRYFLIPFGILTLFLGILIGHKHPDSLNKGRSRRKGTAAGWVWGAGGGGWSGGGGFGGFGEALPAAEAPAEAGNLYSNIGGQTCKNIWTSLWKA